MKILKVKCLAPTRLDNYLTQQYPALTPGDVYKRQHCSLVEEQRQRLQEDDILALSCIALGQNSGLAHNGALGLLSQLSLIHILQNDGIVHALDPQQALLAGLLLALFLAVDRGHVSLHHILCLLYTSVLRRPVISHRTNLHSFSVV